MLWLLYCRFDCVWFLLFFFKQKTAYEMRISDWSSDVCSSDPEATAVDVGEQRRCSSAWRFLQPVLHRSADLACERRAPFLAALADAPDMRAGAQRDGAAIEEIGRAHV